MPAPSTEDDLDAVLGPRMSTELSPYPSDILHAVGRFVTLEGLRVHHLPSLYKNLGLPDNDSVFQFLPQLRPDSPEHFGEVLKTYMERGFIFYAIKSDPKRLSPSPQHDESGPSARSEVTGLIAFLDIERSHRALEVGGVAFGPSLQRTTAATEAVYLLLCHAFGDDHVALSPSYRRVVWKCNELNKASRRAAERLGFVYEGTFRKHMIYGGRSRNSEFFSILDDEWNSHVKAGLESWLSDDNFDSEGKQISRLEECRERCKVSKT